MINTFVHDVENDYFIPQMLKHKKSADFIPERMNELFDELIEEEFQSYSDIINKDLECIVDDNRRRKVCLQQDQHTTKRLLHKAQLINENVKTELSSGQEKLSRIKKLGKSNIDHYDSKIQKIDDFNQFAFKELAKLKNTTKELESSCTSTRNLFDEIVKNENKQMYKYINKIKDQMAQHDNEMKSIRSVSKPKLLITLKQYQIENESIVKSMTDVLEMFNSNLDENPESHVSDYVIQLYKPFKIGEKRIRPKSINKGLQQYYENIDNQIRDQARNSKIQEEQLIREIDQLERPAVYSPRNLRMIYAARMRARSGNASYMTDYSLNSTKSTT